MVTIEISKSAQPRDSSIPGYVDPGRVYLSTSTSGDVVDLWTELTVSGNQKWSLHGPGMRPHDYDTDSQFTQIKSAGEPNVRLCKSGRRACTCKSDPDSCSNYLTMDPHSSEVHLAPPEDPENPRWQLGGDKLDWAILPTGKNDDDGEPLWWIQTKRHHWCKVHVTDCYWIPEQQHSSCHYINYCKTASCHKGGRYARCNFAGGPESTTPERVWLSTTSNGDNVDLWSNNEQDNNQMWRITCLEDDA